MLVLPICFLLVTATALPASEFLVNAASSTSLNATLASTALTAVPSWAPINYSDISISITAIAGAIPEDEVINTFIGAKQYVEAFLDEQRDQGIVNNQFKYRGPDGWMMIAVAALVGQEITWRRLWQVLEALDRFMTSGKAPNQPHYQELDFDIKIVGQVGSAGIGLIWYSPPSSNQGQKRTRTALPFSSPNGTSLPFANGSSSLQLSMAGEDPIPDPIPYPIPRTTLTLSFYYLNLSLPVDLVDEAIRHAMSWSRPFASGPHAKDIVPAEQYRWIVPASGGPKVAVTIFIAGTRKLTWSNLWDSFYGLWQFVTGMNGQKAHYQTLACRILEESEGKIGVLTLSYYDPAPGLVERRAEISNKSLSSALLSQPANSDVDQLSGVANGTRFVSLTVTIPRRWSVPGTEIAFTGTHRGAQVPSIDIITAIGGAQIDIVMSVQTEPSLPIPQGHYKYINASGNLRLDFQTYMDREISWKQLHQILKGLSQSCADGHKQVLFFEVDIGQQGRIGFGVVQYPLASRDADSAKKRSLDTTPSLLPKSSASVPTNMIISGSGDVTLVVYHLGGPIPPQLVRALLSYVLSDTSNDVDGKPNDPVLLDWYSQEQDGMTISVLAEDHPTTWSQLNEVFIQLKNFMTGSGDLPEVHYRALQYFADIQDVGRIVHGLVMYLPQVNTVELMKRATTPAPSLPSTVGAVSHERYPIVGTPMTLDILFMDQGTISPAETSATLTSALRRIYPHVKDEGTIAIPNNQWAYSDNVTNIVFAIAVFAGRTLSWQQLSWVILGLLHWMTTPGRASCKILVFDVDENDQGFLAMGTVSQTSASFAGISLGERLSANETRERFVEPIGKRYGTANSALSLVLTNWGLL